MVSEPSNGAYIFSEDIPWQSVDPGVERKILGYDGSLMMVCVRFERGAVGSLHRHVHCQVTFVQSGRFEVSIDGETRTLATGDCFFVRPEFEHGVVALEAGILVDVFTPMREDFLG